MPTVYGVDEHGNRLTAAYTVIAPSEVFPAVQTAWAPVGTLPLTDAQALAGVLPQAENRSSATAANAYRPSDTELAAFYAATPSFLGDTLRKHVTGRPGLSSPTTDMLIQWASLKWGIPTDWIRAEAVQETHWHQVPTGPPTGALVHGLGDIADVGTSYPLYPPQAQIPGGTKVYTSMGFMQVKWLNSVSFVHSGTEPLRWKSTAFNLDYYAHWVRYCYEGLNVGNPSTKFIPNTQGLEWPSIGQWFGGTATTTASYLTAVQSFLASKPWLQPGF